MSDRFRILVLEDEAIVGMDLACSLEESGFAVLGPFTTAEKALDALQSTRPDMALLDLNLGQGRTSEAVARHLTTHDIPFMFLTGYGASSHPVIEAFAHADCVCKPADPDQIAQKISQVLQAHPAN